MARKNRRGDALGRSISSTAPRVGFPPRHRSVVLRCVLASDVRIDGAMRFLRCMKFARLNEFATLHRQLGMPTLFVWGANDPTFPEPRARAVIPQFPNVTGFHTVANGKLFLYEEQPKEVARLVDRFLSEPQQENAGRGATR